MFYALIATLFFLLSGQSVMAESNNTERFQGIISSTEGLPYYLMVNERKILLDEGVEIKDPKEKKAALSDLKEGKWVYIVSEEKGPGLIATRIFLIPRRVKDKERDHYPFMTREEESEE